MNNMLKHYRPFTKSFSLKATALITTLLFSVHSPAYQAIDKTIAVVGEDLIFSSELEKKIAQAKVRLTTRGTNFSQKKLRSQVLEQLVLERLQLNIANRNNISASKEDIQRALNSTQKNLQRSGLNFEQYIKLQGITKEDAIKEIEKEVKIQKVQQSAVNRRISVTDKEVDNFLDSKAGQQWLTPRFQLGHIFLPATNKTKAQVLKQANTISQQLTTPGQSFQRIAQQYSKGPNASKGGNLGTQTKEDMPELFAQKVDALQVGDISEPFSSPAGVHILKLLSRNGAEPVVVKQYKVRHILVKPTDLFTKEEAKSKIERIYQRLIGGEDFVQLAKESTDDIGTKLKGGDLGWSSPGVFVPAFEKAMSTTPVGDISQPFSSQFGWHVLQVQDTRKRDIFDQVKRQQVSNILRRKRFQDELQIWLQELRENNYVELLI